MLTESDLLATLDGTGPRWRHISPEPAKAATADYFNHARPDILAAVPPQCRSILELGCGAGVLGAAVKQRQECTYIGIELDETAARVAAGRLDAVLAGSIGEQPLPFADGSADGVVCADVLEHLSDPWSVLADLRRILQPGGALVASVPNVAHVDVVAGLSEGRWDYLDAGILDRTHLRFFTRATFAEALVRAGYQITGCSYTVLPQHAALVNPSDPTPKTVRIGRFVLERMTQADLAELVAYQWIFVATPAEASGPAPA